MKLFASLLCSPPLPLPRGPIAGTWVGNGHGHGPTGSRPLQISDYRQRPATPSRCPASTAGEQPDRVLSAPGNHLLITLTIRANWTARLRTVISRDLRDQCHHVPLSWGSVEVTQTNSGSRAKSINGDWEIAVKSAEGRVCVQFAWKPLDAPDEV